MRGLYAIVDVDFAKRRGIDPLELLSAVLEGGAGGTLTVQIRAKSLGAGAYLEILRAAVNTCRRSGVVWEAGVRLYANDRPDLALLAGCDGVHVGQDDLPVEDVRHFAPSLSVGVSTHDLAQLDAALALAPDYVAFGPVFPTASKDRPDPVVGLEGLEQASRRVGSVPLVAIGGIDVESAPRVAGLATACAVIGALVPDEGLAGVPGRVRQLMAAHR